MTCNATLTLRDDGSYSDYRVVCVESPPCRNGVHRSTDPWVQWTDYAPGAVPHHDPKPPRYHAVPGVDGGWGVEAFTDIDAWLIAEFSGGHPDPEGAAEQEVARLNADEVGHWQPEWDRLRVDRDRFKQQRNEAQDAHHRLAEALETIADAPHRCDYVTPLVDIARAALEGTP